MDQCINSAIEEILTIAEKNTNEVTQPVLPIRNRQLWRAGFTKPAQPFLQEDNCDHIDDTQLPTGLYRQLPKQYRIRLSELTGAILATYSRRFEQPITPVQLERFIAIFCDYLANPITCDFVLTPEDHQILSGLTTPEFTSGADAMRKYYLADIDGKIHAILEMWREHCEVDIDYQISTETDSVILQFSKASYTDKLELVLASMVGKMIDNDEFVPYKYLRALGRI